MAHGRLAVVLTLVELAPAPIADSRAPGRSGHEVERRLALTAQPAAGEPAHELGLADVEVDHPVELLTELLQQAIQGLGLGNRPREAVEDEPARGVGLAQALGDEADHHVVGDQRAGVHDALGLATQRRAGRDRLAQHLAGGDLRHMPLAGQLTRLRPLAGAGRAEEDQPHALSSSGQRRPSATWSA